MIRKLISLWSSLACIENSNNRMKLKGIKYDEKFNDCDFYIIRSLPIDDWKINVTLKFIFSHLKIQIIKEKLKISQRSLWA